MFYSNTTEVLSSIYWVPLDINSIGMYENVRYLNITQELPSEILPTRLYLQSGRIAKVGNISTQPSQVQCTMVMYNIANAKSQLYCLDLELVVAHVALAITGWLQQA